MKWRLLPSQFAPIDGFQGVFCDRQEGRNTAWYVAFRLHPIPTKIVWKRSLNGYPPACQPVRIAVLRAGEGEHFHDAVREGLEPVSNPSSARMR